MTKRISALSQVHGANERPENFGPIPWIVHLEYVVQSESVACGSQHLPCFKVVHLIPDFNILSRAALLHFLGWSKCQSSDGAWKSDANADQDLWWTWFSA